MDEKLLKYEEKIVFTLRELFHKYGYLPYKMSKFEEYELYMRNKEFMVSDRVIAFNDTNGKLLALKPDVTFSIIKSGEDKKGYKQKVYYNENVYRVSESTHRYKEIMQAGLECIGDIDLYDIYEVISLAAESLAKISDSFVIELSHMGVLSAVLESVCANSEFINEAILCISQKNPHDLKKVCDKYSVDGVGYEKICTLISAYGERDSVISALESICEGNDLKELKKVSDMLKNSPFSENILIDFSVVNDMNYYNGFMFKGFLNGVCNGVLSGGQYDRMMEKMNRRSSAIGFAVYIDMLEQLSTDKSAYDVDCLVLYDDTTESETVAKAVRETVCGGLSVSAQKTVPEKLKYSKLYDLRKDGNKC